MDSLTQIVLGAAVGEAVLGKKVGNKAMLWGAIAGTVPDLDVLVKLFSDDLIRNNELHRGFSHSILFCLIAAPIFGYLVSKIYRNREANWKDWTRLMWWSLFTHPLLDAHTTWGTQLFWPFDLRVAYNNIFIVDPLYTIPFLLFTIAAMFYKRTNPKRRYINWLGISLSSAYMLLTIAFKGYSHYTFTKELERQNISYDRLSTKPTPLNSILWMATGENDSSFFTGYYSLLDKKDTIDFTFYPKPKQLHDNLMRFDKVKRLAKLTEGWYLIKSSVDSRQSSDLEGTYLFYDLRFGENGFGGDLSGFIFCYEISIQGNEAEVKQCERDFKMKELFSMLMRRVKGI